MSYSGTVYCSYCARQGHNKRGCPDRKEYIANNPDSWTATRDREAELNRKTRGRRCSYCDFRGHTVRTCDKKKTDKQILVQKLTKTRRNVLDAMANSGLGIGALVEVKRSSWRDVPRELGLVTSIDWKRTAVSHDVHFIVSLVSEPTMTFRYYQDLNHEEINTYFILSRASIDSIEKSAPAEWLNGTLYDEEEYFPKGGNRQFWHFDEQ